MRVGNGLGLISLLRWWAQGLTRLGTMPWIVWQPTWLCTLSTKHLLILEVSVVLLLILVNDLRILVDLHADDIVALNLRVLPVNVKVLEREMRLSHQLKMGLTHLSLIALWQRESRHAKRIRQVVSLLEGPYHLLTLSLHILIHFV